MEYQIPIVIINRFAPSLHLYCQIFITIHCLSDVVRK